MQITKITTKSRDVIYTDKPFDSSIVEGAVIEQIDMPKDEFEALPVTVAAAEFYERNGYR